MLLLGGEGSCSAEKMSDGPKICGALWTHFHVWEEAPEGQGQWRRGWKKQQRTGGQVSPLQSLRLQHCRSIVFPGTATPQQYSPNDAGHGARNVPNFTKNFAGKITAPN